MSGVFSREQVDADDGIGKIWRECYKNEIDLERYHVVSCQLLADGARKQGPKKKSKSTAVSDVTADAMAEVDASGSLADDTIVRMGEGDLV